MGKPTVGVFIHSVSSTILEIGIYIYEMLKNWHHPKRLSEISALNVSRIRHGSAMGLEGFELVQIEGTGLSRTFTVTTPWGAPRLRMSLRFLLSTYR